MTCMLYDLRTSLTDLVSVAHDSSSDRKLKDDDLLLSSAFCCFIFCNRLVTTVDVLFCEYTNVVPITVAARFKA
jgi:hypothetical protein